MTLSKLTIITQSSHSGFTLVETLVAITVLLIGVIGPLTIASRGISEGLFVKNQIIGNYLAQEGLDHLINLRNRQVNNGVSGQGQFSVIESTYQPDCEVENLDYNGSIYEDVGQAGRFKRTTCITDVTLSGDPHTYNHKQVVITVEWKNALAPRQVKLVSYLYVKQ